MRIIVCVKQVYDPKSIRISRSREELDMREAVLITNPPDRYALEAALRLRETAGGEVIALTGGDAAAEDTAREAVAIGADRAVLVTGSLKLEAETNAASPVPSFQLLASSVVTRIIAAVVDRLAPGYRAPLILRYWHELSYAEIAEVMGLSVEAVKSRLHRARLQLADARVQPGAPLVMSAVGAR